MANCQHAGVGICKSCKQTISEGGDVPCREEAKLETKPKARVKK